MKKLSYKALSLKSKWLEEDQTFFMKYQKDKKTMQIVNALAEMIATYDSQSRGTITFYC